MKVLQEIQAAMNSDTILVAVSKYRSIDDIQCLQRLGVTDFGENRIQELASKAQQLPELHWHFIGRLQTNKVAQAIQYAHLIHSLDRIRLAEALQKEAARQHKMVHVLLQVNLSREASKTGFFQEEVLPFLHKIEQYPNLKMEGLMCMGPHTDDGAAIRETFHQAKQLYDQIQLQVDSPQITMQTLSMGMSNDYQLALQEGSNLLRIGSLLFDAL